ncbi:MAG: hypothetical protein C0599_11755 [Salinivirgaceae bacterium]|nr:MAG: hypothetical protein C0599_11755 [Salinivirgaceae bacterium]
MKYRIIFIINILLIVNNTFSQNDFRNGYIITNENDTIVGQIDYRSNLQNYKSCIFKVEEKKIKYNPGDIFGYGYDNDKFFSSQIVNGEFVEVLVLGDLSLYKSLNKYFLKKDTTIFVLESFYETVMTNNRYAVRVNTEWYGIISYLISDCFTNTKNLIERISFNEKELANLVVKYNKCKGASFKEFKSKKQWVEYNYSATIGLVGSDIQISNSSSSFSYLFDKSYSVDPSVGVQFNILFPRIAEKISLQGEMSLMKSSYYSSVLIKGYPDVSYDNNIDLIKLSFPISVKRFFPVRNYLLYIQGGFNYELLLSAKASLATGIVTEVGVEETELSEIDINRNQVGLFGGIGVLKSFKKLKAGLVARYFKITSENSDQNFKLTSNSIAISLILMKN